MKVLTGNDHQARTMGGDLVGESGTATGTTASTLTNSGASFPTSGSGACQGYTGHIVAVPGAYGVILSNTGTALTIDFWHTLAAPQTVASTPGSTTTYVVLPGQAPAWWIALSTNATAPSTSHVLLDNGSGVIAEVFGASMAGLSRQYATYGHTAGASTYTLTKQFTMTGSDPQSSNVIQKIGVFAHGVTASPSASTSGTMLFETALTAPPTLVTGDQLTITETVTT